MDIQTEISSLKMAVRAALRNGDEETAKRALEELNAASEEAGAAGIGEAEVFTLEHFAQE
jgi:hypothetical protein